MTFSLPCLQAIQYGKSPFSLDNIQFIFLQQVELSAFLKQKQTNFLTFLRRSDNIGDGTIGTYSEWRTLLNMKRNARTSAITPRCSTNILNLSGKCSGFR